MGADRSHEEKEMVYEMKIAVILPQTVYNRGMNKLNTVRVKRIFEMFEEGRMLKEIILEVDSNPMTVRRYLNEEYGRDFVRSKTVSNFKQRYKTGVDNPLWKGGREVTRQGYIRVWIGGKRILEHRYVMEQHLGRELTGDEQVHHLNGIKSDNKITNLELMPKGEHVRLHNLTKTPLIPRDKKGRFAECV